MSSMNIVVDDPGRGPVRALLEAHLAGMRDNTPPESVHALDIDGLRAPDITFWTAWDGDELLGCGALKELDKTHAEIKSMRTADAHLGKGVASRLMDKVLEVAEERGYRRLSLETGSGEPFEAAHRLYEKFGFEFCGPFADYGPDPFSRFMTRTL